MTSLGVAPLEVWHIALDEEEARTNASYRDLVPEDLRRAGRLVREADRRRFVVARAALRRILGAALGLPPTDVALATGPDGKPRLAQDRGLAFNLSHSEGAALLALSREDEVGVDIERQRTIGDMVSIARRMFSPREATLLVGTPEPLRPALFLRLWTAKEALLKATGVGLAGLDDLAADRRLPIDRRSGEAAVVATPGRRRVERRTSGWLVTPIEAPPGYVAALARPHGARPVMSRKFMFRA